MVKASLCLIRTVDVLACIQLGRPLQLTEEFIEVFEIGRVHGELAMLPRGYVLASKH